MILVKLFINRVHDFNLFTTFFANKLNSHGFIPLPIPFSVLKPTHAFAFIFKHG